MTIVDLVESMYVPEEEGQDFIDYLSNASNGSEVKLLAAIKELNWARNFTKQVYNFLNILLYQIPHNLVELSELDRFVPDPNLQVRLLTDDSFSDRIKQEAKPVIMLKSQSLNDDQSNSYSDVLLSDLR
jgi:L-fucose mutarotase/ribose pyranase (RbsD/FucU family)